MKKIVNTVLDYMTIMITYAVFYGLYTAFIKVPGVGQTVQALWWVPFSILTLYMVKEIKKDFRVAKNGVV